MIAKENVVIVAFAAVGIVATALSVQHLYQQQQHKSRSLLTLVSEDKEKATADSCTIGSSRDEAGLQTIRLDAGKTSQGIIVTNPLGQIVRAKLSNPTVQLELEGVNSVEILIRPSEEEAHRLVFTGPFVIEGSNTNAISLLLKPPGSLDTSTLNKELSKLSSLLPLATVKDLLSPCRVTEG